MELLNVPLFFKKNLKFHGDRQTDEQTENSQKISLFQIFLKIESSRLPIHFKVAAAVAAHPLRDKNYLLKLLFKLERRFNKNIDLNT